MSIDPQAWAPTFVETIYIMASLIMLFFIFGWSIYLKTMEKADKNYLIKRKLKRILRHIPNLEGKE